MGKHWLTNWFTKGRIIYFLVFGVLWLFWQLFTDELAEIIRNHIPGGGIVMYCATHPYVIMPIILILSCIFLLWRSFKKQGEQARKQSSPPFSVGELLGYIHARKCSKCGWGIKVSVFNKVVTCPKCGNVDENT